MDNHKADSKVYIVILNYNSWNDTLECLESVYRNNYSNYSVIVCDNGSEDDSLQKIRKWADGGLAAKESSVKEIAAHTMPPVKKPMPYIGYEREEAESGGNEGFEAPLILIDNGNNLGFAGGNNVGIRYALSRNDFEYIWLLNNDTVIDPDALCYLVKRMEEKPEAGMCGSTLLHYYQPDRIQSRGGLLWRNIYIRKPTPKLLGLNEPYDRAAFCNVELIEKEMEHVIGASMLVSKKFITDIGLLCEDYSFFFEEADWAERAKGKYSLGYALKSIVYHKGEASGSTEARSYQFCRSMILFALKHCPQYLKLCGKIVPLLFLPVEQKGLKETPFEELIEVFKYVANEKKFWEDFTLTIEKKYYVYQKTQPHKRQMLDELFEYGLKYLGK